MDFKTDLSNLINLINDGHNQDEIKKEYLKLVKKYHPDGVAENLKSTCNEYMVVLNSVYAKGKTKVQEVNFLRNYKPKKINKIWRNIVERYLIMENRSMKRGFVLFMKIRLISWIERL